MKALIRLTKRTRRKAIGGSSQPSSNLTSPEFLRKGDGLLLHACSFQVRGWQI